MPPHETIHACAIELNGRGVLIEGPAGSGKTSLALGLVEAAMARGLAASLVSDDRTLLEIREGGLDALPAPTLAGKVEIRGLGIVAIRHLPRTRLCLALRLVEPGRMERMPQPRLFRHEGTELPLLEVPARDERAGIRLAFAALGMPPYLPGGPIHSGDPE